MMSVHPDVLYVPTDPEMRQFLPLSNQSVRPSGYVWGVTYIPRGGGWDDLLDGRAVCRVVWLGPLLEGTGGVYAAHPQISCLGWDTLWLGFARPGRARTLNPKHYKEAAAEEEAEAEAAEAEAAAAVAVGP
jgi:hypothetical protein